MGFADMDRSEPALSVENVSKSYGEVEALRDVSLSVQPGEFVALIGPNGAGKSTLLQLLTGLFAPDSGSITVLGQDIGKHATRALAGIGVVFQQQTLDLELSVKANLIYHADLHGLSRKLARERVTALLDEYGLGAVASARARTLSGGNRRRVELARARLHGPRLLLMDEATVGLDPNSRGALLEDMTRLTRREGISVLWATHLIDELHHADRMIMLDKGRVLYDGTTGDLMKRERTDDLTQTILGMMGGNDARALLASGEAD
jgi:ABC-2 type transport system ATP-binding protein